MKDVQFQIEKCPVCGCAFYGGGHATPYLDWVVEIKSENAFVPLIRCSSCYSPFYIKKDGEIQVYLGNATE